MTNVESQQEAASLSLEQALQQAIAHHQAGQLQEAEHLYRCILQVHPAHPEANHNLGVLAVQVKQSVAALPYFKVALEANPNQGQYWLSYIDALIQANETVIARKVLEQGMQRGLQGEAVEVLADRLNKSSKAKLPLDEMNEMIALFNKGRYAETRTLAESITARYPQQGIGWKVLGAVFKQMGQKEAALKASQKAAELMPDDANAYSNLGAVLQDCGRPEEAVTCCRRALEINPDYFEAHYNLGNAMQNIGRIDEAVACYRRAIEIKPDYTEAHYNLGNVMRDRGQLDEAVACFHRVLETKPDFSEVYCQLGGIFQNQGKLSEALSCYQQLAGLDPENGVARHQIAALKGNNVERANDQYVGRLFDGYASKFDGHLLEVLKYETPEKLLTLVKQRAMPPIEKWNVLDLGCGTGLVGAAIAPFARWLVGVDLSAKMLEKARARNVYQRLEHSDLLTMMRGEKVSCYDVIIAADVFVYIGKLDETMSEIKRLLCPGGIVAFSVETMKDMVANQEAPQEYKLESTGRYSHASSYINKLAAHGFLPVEMVETNLRMEQGKPVNGHLILWKNGASK